MRNLAIIAAALSIGILISPRVYAQMTGCQNYGTSTIATCRDQYGNTYTINRNAGVTTMNGYNTRTGSNWSQTTLPTVGGTSTSGYTNGKYWNEQQSCSAAGCFISGVDASGKSYNHFCTPDGRCQ